jgi:HAD superfamily hydrolase (TIGR01509 family)
LEHEKNESTERSAPVGFVVEATGAWRFESLKRVRKISGVLFDWDGVLLDSLGVSFNVYNKIFAKMGTKQLTRDEFFNLQSPNWYEFYSKVGLPTSMWKQVDEEWMRLYRDESPGLYPDAMKCLTDLKASHFRLALVSNGSKARVEGELGEFGLKSFFLSVSYGEKKEELKPSPVMLRRALVAIELPPSNSVFVGDAPADIQAAKNAGVPSIAIARGPIQEERLRAENPDHIFGGLGEMTDFLARVDSFEFP